MRKMPIERMRRAGLARRAWSRLAQPLVWSRFNHFCAERLVRGQAAIAHAHFGTTAARVLPALERVRIPLAVLFYGVDASAALRSPAYAESYALMYRRADRLIVLCEAVRTRLIDRGCDSSKIVIWNLPAGIEKYPYQPRRSGAVTRFIISARFVEKKGHEYLIPAFERLLATGRKATLTMMGYGPLKGRFEAEVRRRRLQDSVTVVDTAQKGDFAVAYGEALKRHDIFVLPSTTASNGDDEGGPALTLVCAQAAGLPVICTPFPGSEITVKNEWSGLLCRENDAESLAERMIHLTDHPELWDRLGKHGSDAAHEQFSEKGQTAKLLDLYTSLLS
jgi:colanic acid/amylovoran biosynthesis glycosyltransferase